MDLAPGLRGRIGPRGSLWVIREPWCDLPSLGPSNPRGLLGRRFCPGQTSAVTHGSDLIPAGLPQGLLSFSTPATCRSQLAGPLRALTHSCREIHGKVPENEYMHCTKADKGCFLSLSWMCWVGLGNQSRYRQGALEQSHKRTTAPLLPKRQSLGFCSKTRELFQNPMMCVAASTPAPCPKEACDKGPGVPWTGPPPDPQPQDCGCPWT